MIRIGLLYFSVIAGAQACLCVPIDEPVRDQVARQYDAAETVVVVKVVAIERKTIEFTEGRQSGRWAVLQPVHVFKGSFLLGQNFYTRMPKQTRHSDCDVLPRVGESMLIYADAPGRAPVHLSECGNRGDLDFSVLPYLFERSGQWPAPEESAPSCQGSVSPD